MKTVTFWKNQDEQGEQFKSHFGNPSNKSSPHRRQITFLQRENKRKTIYMVTTLPFSWYLPCYINDFAFKECLWKKGTPLLTITHTQTHWDKGVFVVANLNLEPSCWYPDGNRRSSHTYLNSSLCGRKSFVLSKNCGLSTLSWCQHGITYDYEYSSMFLIYTC